MKYIHEIYYLSILYRIETINNIYVYENIECALNYICNIPFIKVTYVSVLDHLGQFATGCRGHLSPRTLGLDPCCPDWLVGSGASVGRRPLRRVRAPGE